MSGRVAGTGAGFHAPRGGTSVPRSGEAHTRARRLTEVETQECVGGLRTLAPRSCVMARARARARARAAVMPCLRCGQGSGSGGARSPDDPPGADGIHVRTARARFAWACRRATDDLPRDGAGHAWHVYAGAQGRVSLRPGVARHAGFDTANMPGIRPGGAVRRLLGPVSGSPWSGRLCPPRGSASALRGPRPPTAPDKAAPATLSERRRPVGTRPRPGRRPAAAPRPGRGAPA